MRKFTSLMVISILLFGSTACVEQTSTDCFEIAAERDRNPKNGFCTVEGYVVTIGGLNFIGDREDEFSSGRIVGMHGALGVWIDRIEGVRGRRVRAGGEYEFLDDTVVSLKVIETLEVLNEDEKAPD